MRQWPCSRGAPSPPRQPDSPGRVHGGNCLSAHWDSGTHLMARVGVLSGPLKRSVSSGVRVVVWTTCSSGQVKSYACAKYWNSLMQFPRLAE